MFAKTRSTTAKSVAEIRPKIVKTISDQQADVRWRDGRLWLTIRGDEPWARGGRTIVKDITDWNDDFIR